MFTLNLALQFVPTRVECSAALRVLVTQEQSQHDAR